MKKHKTLWVGMICVFVPILITIFLILFVFNQVGKMGENEILHKTPEKNFFKKEMAGAALRQNFNVFCAE